MADYTRYIIEICRAGETCSAECPRLVADVGGAEERRRPVCDLFSALLRTQRDDKHPLCCDQCLELTDESKRPINTEGGCEEEE
jgi:hypothetical protein